MIEERIQILRRAAQISTEDREEKVWCVIAGNDRLVDDIAYNAITRQGQSPDYPLGENVSITSKHSYKKFDCIMLKGETLKIRELKNKTHEEGGASLQITTTSLERQPNLLVVIGPEESMKRFVGQTSRQEVKIDILLEDHTTGFIKSEPKSTKIPKFLKNFFNPIIESSEVILSVLLISVKDEGDIDKVKGISQENSLFGIDLKSTIQDKEIARLKERKAREKAKKEEAEKKEKEEKEKAKKESEKKEKEEKEKAKKEESKEDKKEIEKGETKEDKKEEDKKD
ncbi:hypothetical protein mru_1835 [Methanobrevibacter ruminantium M1]|uniref:Uncharacterized protein n=1 Tax=Methanobrevibacter ruminantium (strain ATCC 35063 / DSM 1093 / JCM 13430 / OCM 146 / M1) TaxID=634498 RepID=D3DZK7_METRM|nr:hypothetical protein [Methanobrevibacter ruminantium]ADC47685.1 hypothetical protein mru_1835 [Methanobrevibacter ruminantium M1]